MMSEKSGKIMLKTSNPYLKALYHIYKTPEILSVPSDKWRQHDQGEDAGLSTYEKWMHHKYLHTFQVLREGAVLINKEPVLKNAPREIQKQWMDALLLHDYGRAFEVCPNKETYSFSFCHGITGAQKALELGETSLNVSVPILVHDQMDNNFIEASDKQLEMIEKFARQPDDKKQAVYQIRSAYQAASDEDRKWIHYGIGLVRDADTLSNLREYRRMLRFLEKEPVCVISPQVKQEIMSDDYVKIEHVKTWPDKCCMYLSWAYHFKFPATLNEVFRAKILENFCEDVYGKIRACNSSEHMERLRLEIDAILKHIRAFDATERFLVPIEPENCPSPEEIRTYIHSYLFQNEV